MHKIEQPMPVSDWFLRLIFLNVLVVIILMSYWNSIWNESFWKVFWFPTLFGSVYIFKHKLSNKIISYLVPAGCLIYCLLSSRFELATGIGGLILMASLAFTFNNLNGNFFLLLLVVHLLTILYMVQPYQDPFGSGYGLPYSPLYEMLEFWLSASVEFALYYISLVILVILQVGYAIHNLKKKN